MSKVQWVEGELPGHGSKRRKRGQIHLFVAQLKMRPGVWAIYKVAAKGVPASTYKGVYPEVQWSQRSWGREGKMTVYARWEPGWKGAKSGGEVVAQ